MQCGSGKSRLNLWEEIRIIPRLYNDILNQFSSTEIHFIDTYYLQWEEKPKKSQREGK